MSSLFARDAIKVFPYLAVFAGVCVALGFAAQEVFGPKDAGDIIRETREATERTGVYAP